MIKHVDVQGPSELKDLTTQTYRQIKQDFGLLAEPFTLHTASPKVLAAVWVLVREVLVVGQVGRQWKEVVATAVSEANRCPYCVDAHVIMFRASNGTGTTDFSNHPDHAVRALFQWGLATKEPSSYRAAIFPLQDADKVELLGTALAFHYINRMVSIFLDATPLPVNHNKLRNIQQHVAGLWLKRSVTRAKPPGESFQLLMDQPEIDLPHLSWLADGSSVARSIKLWHSTLQAGGDRSLTQAARQRTQHYLDTWEGNDPPLGNAWLEEAVDGLQGIDLIGAKLGIMTAVCPYRVTPRLIAEYYGFQKTASDLIDATAWASMQAALHIAAQW